MILWNSSLLTLHILHISIIPSLMVSGTNLPYTSTYYYCFQERSVIWMESIYPLTHFPVIWISGLRAGNHTQIASNLNLPTSSSVVIRCLLGTSTSFLV